MTLGSCAADEEGVDLPETPVLAEQGGFALVAEMYVRMHARPDVSSAVLGHARMGDVLEVVGRTADDAWLELEGIDSHGWVRSVYLRRFASRPQAINGRALLEDSYR